MWIYRRLIRPAGLLAVDEAGRPFQRRYHIDRFCELADEASVPRTVRNIIARHVGATEAREVCRAIGDVADHLQKTDIEGRRDYVATIRRVAAARVTRRRGNAHP